MQKDGKIHIPGKAVASEIILQAIEQNLIEFDR